MSYLRGLDRSQVQCLPPSIDEYVTAESPTRVIDAFVDQLDLEALGFQRSKAAETGRPAYHPGDLLKLYIYGYLNRVRSSRRLEIETHRNLEVMFLLRGLTPDHKTIADFRKDNRECFKGVFKQFNLLCRKLDLFGAELVAIDGSKFKAVNNPARRFTTQQFAELVQTIEKKIEEFLQQLEQQDAATEGPVGTARATKVREKIAQLQAKKGRINELVEELKESEATSPATDLDSTVQKRVGVQVAVDAKHHLIAAQEVVCEANDRGQLSAMAAAAKAELAVDTLKVVADAGYHESEQLQQCADQGVETYVPAQGTTSGQSKDGQKIFPKEAFVYEAGQDSYRCPAGQQLTRRYEKDDKGKRVTIYMNRKACAVCPLKTQCTKSVARKISRGAYEGQAEKVAARVAVHPEVVAKRKTIVEHVFGSLRNWSHDTFLTKGISGVRAEFSLSALTYNLKRVLQLKPAAGLIKALSLRPAQA